jgi:hypothetical protein
MRRVVQVRPFRQGGLDSLCGIYAIINGLRWVLRGDRRLRSEDYDSLFEILVYRAHKSHPKIMPSVEGIDTPLLSKLLRHAVDHCRDQYELDIQISRPLLKRRQLTVREALKRLRNELECPTATILIGLGGIDHWTVVRSITNHNLILYDSSGRKLLPLRRCQMIDKEPQTRRSILIIRTGTFVLRNPSE